jgi:geranylgeranyl pyrophosphate synthase
LRTVGQEDLTDSDITAIQQVIIETGALNELEDLITSLRDEAIFALAHTTLGSEAVNELNELAHYVTDRDV